MEFDRLVVGFLVDEVVGGFFISVPPGHIACLYDRGRGVLPRVWGPGLHLKIPFWQIAKLFNAQILEYTIREGFDITNRESLGDQPIKTATKDSQYIQMEGSILFRINKARAPELWENIGDHFVSKVIRPISRSRISNLISQYSYEDMVNHRPELEIKVKDALNQEFNNKGLICEGFLMSEVKKVPKS
jgi:regulator of protease activity HflC (stomatin/prohibitin superfamily)